MIRGNEQPLAERAERVELNVYPRYPFVPVRGEGCYLFDEEGKRYLDMYAGHAVALTGHCHPTVVAAIKAQAEKLIFYSNAVHCAERVQAAEMLLARAPLPGSRVFFCCSGSEANDNAIKVARKLTGRRKVISFTNSFHGRTVSTLSASGMEKYRQTAGTVLVEGHQFVPFGDLSALHAAADDDTAAIVCETIQSLGGVKTVDDGFFFLMEEIAKKSGAMLIFDEVQSGLGRCGTFFFAEKVCAKPDMVTMAKGLASGLPVGALVTSPAISDRLKPGDLGSTFGGGPVPMAAMRATMQVIEEEQLPLNAERVGQVLMEGLAQVAGVKEVRGRGLLIGVEFEQPVKPILGQLIERGFIAGSSSDPHTMRLLPPLILTEAQAREFLDALTAVAQA